MSTLISIEQRTGVVDGGLGEGGAAEHVCKFGDALLSVEGLDVRGGAFGRVLLEDAEVAMVTGAAVPAALPARK